jgi:hypothetical protein
LQLALTQVVAPATTYAENYAAVTRLFAPVLFTAFALYLIFETDDRKSQLVLWIMGLFACLTIAISGYVFEFFGRIFAFGLIPIAYGVAKLFQSNRRQLRAAAVSVLLIALVLHLPAHYGQDAFNTSRSHTPVGLSFLAIHSSPAANVSSPLAELHVSYYIDIYRTANSNPESKQVNYFVMSYEAEQWALYLNGDKYSELLHLILASNSYNTVYSSGLFTIYLENN